MNKTRMLELADAIEAAPKNQFDMQTFVSKFTVDKNGRRRTRSNTNFVAEEERSTLREMSCGTSACIAGWAVHLHPLAGLKNAYPYGRPGFYDIGQQAQAILGLTGYEAEILFYHRMNRNNIQAATFIRRCVELGTVPAP